MSLILFDGFDSYPNNSRLFEGKWSEWDGAYAFNTDLRTGQMAINCGSGSNYLRRSFPAVPEVIIGAAIRMRSASTGYVGHIFDVMDGSTIHCFLEYNTSDQYLRLKRGDGTLLAGPAWLAPTSWSFIELKVKVGDADGAYEVRVNGATWWKASNVDTRNGGNASTNKAGIGGIGVGLTTDDFYLLDTRGSTFNDFLGEIQVITLRPNAAGSLAEWTPSSGSNYQGVDDAQYDTADFVSTDFANNKDSYNLNDIGNYKAYQAVQVVAYAARATSGVASTMKTMPKDTAGEYPSTLFTAGDSHQAFLQVWETNPNGGGAWSKTAIDSLEIGVELIS